MHSEHGFIKYFVGVVIKALNPADGVIKTSREFVVQAPMKNNLMVRRSQLFGIMGFDPNFYSY